MVTCDLIEMQVILVMLSEVDKTQAAKTRHAEPFENVLK